MAKKNDLKDMATELLSAAAHAAEDFAENLSEVGKPLVEKTAEMGAPLAAKAAEVTKETLEGAKGKLQGLESHGEAALAAVEKHANGQKKSHTGRNVTCATLALAGAGGVAYLLWRRSRPVEDPWAEEYWVDLQDEVASDEELAAEEAAVEEAALDEAIVEAIEEAVAEAEEKNK